MDKMKMRLTNAVAGKLSAAPHSTAKTELIEELSDNLYRRYQDMTAGGMEESAAFDRALDELGDVDELLTYLNSLSPEEELPRLTLHPYEEQERAQDELDGLLSAVDDVVKGAVEQAKSALDQAKDALKKAGRSVHCTSGDSSFELHFDPRDDDHGEHPQAEGRGDGTDADWGHSFSAGFSKDKRGFFFEADGGEAPSGHPVAGSSIPARDLRGIDVQTVNGDVTIHLTDGDDVTLDGDVEQLEVKVTDSGVLAIRQGKTASSSFFFLRGLSSADVELYLPRRRWGFIQVSAVNGDVTLEDGLELERLSVKTTSGDLTCRCDLCGQFYFKSASGDLSASGLTGDAQAETMSGDLLVSGHMGRVQLSSMSGDVELSGSVQQARLSSLSGDVHLETALSPEEMALSSKSGDCTARLPAGEPFTLRYKTTSGSFHSQFPLTRTSGGAIYDGGGSRTYSMTSISGDLSLQKY